MALSDLIIRQARAAGKSYNLPDTDGLGLVVSPAGGKSWHFRYYWLGKQKRMSLGTYPDLRQGRPAELGQDPHLRHHASPAAGAAVPDRAA